MLGLPAVAGIATMSVWILGKATVLAELVLPRIPKSQREPFVVTTLVLVLGRRNYQQVHCHCYDVFLSLSQEQCPSMVYKDYGVT